MGLDVLEIDPATPHPGVTIDGTTAQRETNGGWVTLRSKTPLSTTNHQWAIRILDQGEGADGSGLMIGLLPQLSAQMASATGGKYISELGGWCISRAGDTYGAWKCDRFPYSTDCVVEFDWDAATGTVYMVSGNKKGTGHIPGLKESDVLYPAVSMYYLNQKVAFV
ncbi:hypothetical protein Q4I28_006521 [Leishmania naiffi]|uniref:B30.2/SPRY domain-containing protein n=1 Tax=Leishmania naiffi TaxID=5678 RepID=A0AAW3BE15_9TRYP